MRYETVETRELPWSGGVLLYELRRTERRTIGIIVEPDRRVVVQAPRTASSERVSRLVCRSLPWIRRQWKRLESFPPMMPPRQWVEGETHRYLGRQYRLRILKGRPEGVKLVGGHFQVAVQFPGDPAAIRRLLESWYRKRAEALLATRVEHVLRATTWLEVELPNFRVQPLRYRWGSTSAAGRITFNVELVKVALPCIDYVVAHELVHLLVPSHSPAFWRMLSRVMPDWKRWKKKLEMVEI